jgi:HlyD family secretion protein
VSAFLLSRFWLSVSMIVVAAGLVASPGLTAKWLSGRLSPGDRRELDSAIVQRPDPGPDRVVAEGCVVAYPGAEVVLGSEALGRLVTLDVREGSTVRKGQLLAALNADDLQASLAEAEAKAAEAEADTSYYERETRHDETLVARRAAAMQDLDRNRHSLETARARHAAAQAQRARSQALIAKTRIIAPIDGVVTARHVHPGEMVGVGDRILTIADLSRLRIEAEVDEFDAARIAPGARVALTAEGHPGTQWRGTVEEIPDAVIGRRLRPQDPGRPIDARVLAVKIAFGEATPLKLGQKVEVEFRATGDGSTAGEIVARDRKDFIMVMAWLSEHASRSGRDPSCSL